MATRKIISTMWMVNEVLFSYTDKELAEQHAEAHPPITKVWVGVDANYFIKAQQPAELFKGWVFDCETLANDCIVAYNLACL